MAIGEIHKGDIGTAFRVTLKDEDGVIQNVSGATTKKLLFKKPDNTLVEKTGAFYTDGTDGIIQYVTVSVNDLDVVGNWSLQAYIVISGATHHSDVSTFKVEPNLD